MSQIPERHRHLQDCVADEGKMVSRMSENQGCFGVKSEGDLVSQMRGLPLLSSVSDFNCQLDSNCQFPTVSYQLPIWNCQSSIVN